MLESDASLQVFDVKYLKEVFYVENGKVPSKLPDKDGGLFECITVSRPTLKSLLVTKVYVIFFKCQPLSQWFSLKINYLNLIRVWITYRWDFNLFLDVFYKVAFHQGEQLNFCHFIFCKQKIIHCSFDVWTYRLCSFFNLL